MTTTIAPPGGADDIRPLTDDEVEEVAGGCWLPYDPEPVPLPEPDDSPVIFVLR